MRISGIRPIYNINNSTKILSTVSSSAKIKYPQIIDLGSVYFKPSVINFGRTKEQHDAWGAQYKPGAGTTFQLFSYPDAVDVKVVVEKSDGRTVEEPMFRDYQAEAQYNDGNTKTTPWGQFGLYRTKVPIAEAIPNDEYYFSITHYTVNKNGEKELVTENVKDPYAFKQNGVNGNSIIYDQQAYLWGEHEKAWLEGKKTERISAIANSENKLTPWKALRIYETNIYTLTKGRTFESAIKELDRIKSEGFNAIEIMPVGGTNSEGWGYDEVDKFAPNELLGGPDAMKKFVEEAHKRGINIIVDIVPNHHGPDGNSLEHTGPYLWGGNQFGPAYNYIHPNNGFVRDYINNVALNWVKNFHADALRVDMTKFMASGDLFVRHDGPLKQLVNEVKHHFPHSVMIAEDGGEESPSGIRGPLTSDELSLKDEEHHVWHIKNLALLKDVETWGRNIGFDSEWAFNFFHNFNHLIYNPDNQIAMENFDKSIENSLGQVKFLMSHDEIGNHEGSRFAPKHMANVLSLYDHVLLKTEDYKRMNFFFENMLQEILIEKYNSQNPKDPYHTLNEQEQKEASKQMLDIMSEWDKKAALDRAYGAVAGQNAQLASEGLAIAYQTGKLEPYKITPDMNEHQKEEKIKALYNDILVPLKINKVSLFSIDKYDGASYRKISKIKPLTYESIRSAFMKTFAQNKMALAKVYSVPGPKMVFQGDDNFDMTSFRFFRKFYYQPEKDFQIRLKEKGYDPYEISLQQSTIGTIEYTPEAKKMMQDFQNMTTDLNRINTENSALIDGIVKFTLQNKGVHGIHSVKGKNEIYAVSNLTETDYPSYNLEMPEGKWVEILNTDDKKYGGSGDFINPDTYNGEDKPEIHMAGFSTIYFKRIE